MEDVIINTKSYFLAWVPERNMYATLGFGTLTRATATTYPYKFRSTFQDAGFYTLCEDDVFCIPFHNTCDKYADESMELTSTIENPLLAAKMISEGFSINMEAMTVTSKFPLFWNAKAEKEANYKLSKGELFYRPFHDIDWTVIDLTQQRPMSEIINDIVINALK